MALLTLATLRDRLADLLTSTAQPTGESSTGSRWHQAPYHYEGMSTLLTKPNAHLAFAIGFPETQYPAPEASRTRRGSVGAAVTSTVIVRWLHRCRADRQVEDLDAAYGAEELLVKALVDDVSLTDVHLTLRRCSRQLAGDGTYLLCDIELTAQYRSAIV
jgi:hypothetical protein